MSAEPVSQFSDLGAAKHAALHPLSPLSASEIVRAADFIRRLYPSAAELQFKAVTLEEPEKARLVPYLEAEHGGRKLPAIDRKAFVSYYIRNTVSRLRLGNGLCCLENPAVAERSS